MARRREADRRPERSADPDHALPWLWDWHCIAALALPLLFFFRKVIFREAFFWEDFLYQFYPFRAFATTAFANGEIPLWNPYTFGGMPFQADITGSVFYVPHVLLLPFAAGGTLSYWYVELYIIAHFLLAGAGMFAVARHFGARRIPATFSALVYMFSAYTVIHVIHLVTLCQIALFPLAVVLVSRTLAERSPRLMILAGFVLALIVFGGHPQIYLYMFTFLGGYAAVELIAGIRAKAPARTTLATAGLTAGFFAIAVLLSAVQLLPTRELADLSVRESITFERASEGQLHWQQLITALIPKFFGSATAAGGENPHPFWGPQVYWNFWCTPLYAGIPALALALFAAPLVRLDRRLAYTAGFAVFALLYALGDNFIVHRAFYEFMPGFNKFRSVGRWGFFWMFAVALFSGLGFQLLFRDGPHLRRLRIIAASLVAVVLAVYGAVGTGLLDRFIAWQATTGALGFAQPEILIPLAGRIASAESLTALVFTAGAGILLVLAARRSIAALPAAGFLLLLQFADTAVFGGEQNNGTTNPDTYFGRQASIVQRLQDEGRTEYFRVNARNQSGMLLDRNQGVLDRLFLMEGYTQLALQRRFPPAASGELLMDLMNVKYRLRTDTVRTGGRPGLALNLVPADTYLPRAFFVYDTRVFATAAQESTFLASPDFDPRRMATFDRDPGVRLSGTPPPGASARITSYTLNSITLRVSTPERGLLVLSEIHYPGWNAAVDGVPTPVHRVNWSLRGCFVEAGEHTVDMRFEPAPFATGAAVSLSTLGLSVLGLGFLARTRRRSAAAAPPSGSPPETA